MKVYCTKPGRESNETSQSASQTPRLLLRSPRKDATSSWDIRLSDRMESEVRYCVHCLINSFRDI